MPIPMHRPSPLLVEIAQTKGVDQGDEQARGFRPNPPSQYVVIVNDAASSRL